MWSIMALIFLAFFTEPGYTQQISGYGPVDVAELNPLTLSWNQVGLNTYMPRYLDFRVPENTVESIEIMIALVHTLFLINRYIF